MTILTPYQQGLVDQEQATALENAILDAAEADDMDRALMLIEKLYKLQRRMIKRFMANAEIQSEGNGD